jgi:hypothetical protein
MTQFVRADGSIDLVGANVSVEVFDTGADKVRKLAISAVMSADDFLVWMERGDEVRAEIMKRMMGANVTDHPAMKRRGAL